MIKAAIGRHRSFEGIFTRMAKGRMADIMGKAQRLGQILIEPQRTRNGAADLRDFKAVGQADTVMIAIRRDEHLRLVAEAAKGNRMDNPVAVALENVARAARFPTRFGVEPSAAGFRIAGKWCAAMHGHALCTRGVDKTSRYLAPSFLTTVPFSLFQTKLLPPALR